MSLHAVTPSRPVPQSNGLRRLAFALILTFGWGQAQAVAAVTLNALFANHAVLQRDVPLPIWGTASPGEHVQMTLNGQAAAAVADGAGDWLATLPPQPAGGPCVMTVSGENNIRLTDIMIGDVWLCSGQSNMEWRLVLRTKTPADPLPAEAKKLPDIRQFAVRMHTALTPVKDVAGAWQVCSPETIDQFSAVAYYFARDVHAARGVPIGILLSTVGGTTAEAWTSADGLQPLGEYAAPLSAAIKTATTNPSNIPPSAPTSLYNGMIAPLQRFPVKGVAWYQGESNEAFFRQYATLFPALIADWRSARHAPAMPFLFVQIAPFKVMRPEIREAQRLSLMSTTATAMVVTTHCGDAEDLHPKNKEPVGAGLALAARALAYGEKIEYAGPLYQSMSVEGSNIVVRFTHTGNGLVAQDGPLRGFTVAGSDNHFIPAKARIDGDAVIVHADGVVEPKAVRFGWANVPDGNLFNTAGLPASPFSSDHW